MPCNFLIALDLPSDTTLFSMLKSFFYLFSKVLNIPIKLYSLPYDFKCTLNIYLPNNEAGSNNLKLIPPT